MQHCFCNSYFYVIFQVLFWVRSEFDTFFFTAHLYIKQFSFNNRVIIVADLTGLQSTELLVFLRPWTLTEKIGEKKLERILGLCQSNTFLPMHVHACALFFLFSVHFANLIIFELSFFYLQSNRSLCQGSCVKTTAAVVFTPQLRSSGWTLWAQMSSK